MENEYFFARGPLSRIFVPYDKNPCDSPIFLRKKECELFCYKHNGWQKIEHFKCGNSFDKNTFVLDCGCSVTGYFLDYIPTPEEKKDEWERSRIERLKKAFSLPDEGVFADVFGFRLFRSDSNKFLVEYMCFDRKSFDDSVKNIKKIQNLPFYTVQHCYGEKKQIYCRKPDFFIQKLPQTVELYAQKILWQVQKEKYKLSRAEALPNSKNFHQDSIQLLMDYPCEPGIGELSTFLKEIDKIQSDDKNGYFKLCEILDIKNWKHLREAFLRNPRAIVWAKNAIICGFKDINIINEIIDYEKSYFIFKTSIFTTFEPLYFFISLALQVKTERNLWQTLKKNVNSYITINDDNSENLSHLSDFYDAAFMFQQKYDSVPEELRHSILYEGLSKYNHDLLAVIDPHNTELIKNEPFQYSSQENELADVIEDYQFILAENPRRLVLLGANMHNCVGSYIYRVRNKLSVIVYVMHNNQESMCIEVRETKQVHQCRTHYNKDPEGKEKEIFEKWYNKHNLYFSSNKF